MTALAIQALAEVRAAGGEVKLVGPERLKVIAPTPLPNHLVDRLRTAKPQLLALLSATTKAIPKSEVEAERTAPGAQLIAPAPWFVHVAPPTEGEPPYEMPCAARRGKVEDRGDVVLHFCTECGAWGSFGYRVNLRGDRLGHWYCAKHRP